jgi:hypothetical protein
MDASQPNPQDDEDGFELPLELESELVEAMAEADRGGTTDGWELLRELRSQCGLAVTSPGR